MRPCPGSPATPRLEHVLFLPFGAYTGGDGAARNGNACLAVGRGPALVALPHPHQDTGRFQGLVDDARQVVSHRVQVDGVLQAARERGHDLVGVVAARLNRRSTARCTRRRSGLNSAATASVEAATATGVWHARTRVASRPTPASTPTTTPATPAYASM